MEIEPNRVPTATLLPASSSDACGIRRVAAKYTKICNTAAAAPPQNEVGQADAVGDAGCQRQAESDQRAAEGEGAGEVAVFNQLQFAHRRDFQINRAENQQHQHGCEHILQVLAVLDE